VISSLLPPRSPPSMFLHETIFGAGVEYQTEGPLTMKHRKLVAGVACAALVGVELAGKHEHYWMAPDHYHTEIPSDVGRNFSRSIVVDSGLSATASATGTAGTLALFPGLFIIADR